MGKVHVRYLCERPRKGGVAYYWAPGAKIVAAGFRVSRLSDNKATAVAQAEEMNRRLDRWYSGVAEPIGARPWSIQALDDLFQRHHSFTTLKPRTQQDYRYNIRPAIEAMGIEIVADIERMAIMLWVNHMVTTRGPANARNAGAAFRRLMGFGRDQGWIKSNPATDLDLPTLPSRDRVWTRAELDQFTAKAIELGHRSMALAVLLGWCLGQRPADLRTLAWSAYDGSAIAIRQGKTGKHVWVPALPELRRLLDSTDRAAVQIVVSEETNRPYKESAFQHEFARIRAAANLPADLQFRDLRRTLATALGAAGCTDDQIRAITGHQTREVVGVYVRPDRTFAESAMKRLEGANRAQIRTDLKKRSDFRSGGK